MATAARASAGHDGQIVSPGQVDTALTTAIVDSALAFLDLIPAVKAVRTAAAAKHGAQTAAGQGMERLIANTGTGEFVTRGAGSREAREQVTERAAREAGSGASARAGSQGIEESAEQAAGVAGQRLRPEDAANWQEVAQHYVGKKLADTGVPPGYVTYQSGGRTFLRRIDARDERFARLTIDPDGLIQAGSARGPAQASRLAQVV